MNASDNNDQRPHPEHDSDHQWLVDQFGAADPVKGRAASEESDGESLQRLIDQWEAVLDGESVSADKTPMKRDGASKSPGWKRRWRPISVLVGLSAAMTGLWLAGWWYGNRPSDDSQPIAEKLKTRETEIEEASNATNTANDLKHQPPGGPTLPEDSLVDSAMPPHPAHLENQIRSVDDLLDLPPRLVQRRLKKADWTALNQELQGWLKRWYAADPALRREMETQWVANRQFWLVWSMQSIEQFDDRDIQSAALELISLDLGNGAKPFLERCLAHSKLGPLALPRWIPLADDRQLTAWLAVAQDCGQIQQVLQELVQRDSPIVTEALADIASHSNCRVLLKDLKGWNAVHQQRAWQALEGSGDRARFQSAMLLSAIPGPSIDRGLLSHIQQGAGVLPATAVLLLRQQYQQSESIRQVAESPLVKTALASARQQVQRWNQQSKQNPSVLLKEVCERCEEKS